MEKKKKKNIQFIHDHKHQLKYHLRFLLSYKIGVYTMKIDSLRHLSYNHREYLFKEKTSLSNTLQYIDYCRE